VGSADPKGLKKLVFGGPSSDKNFKKLRVMNGLKTTKANDAKPLLWALRIAVLTY